MPTPFTQPVSSTAPACAAVSFRDVHELDDVRRGHRAVGHVLVHRRLGGTVPLMGGGTTCDWGTGLGVSHTKGLNFAFTQVTVPDRPSEGSS